jgi:glycosyltransferase involved in cell wall biosynthesis
MPPVVPNGRSSMRVLIVEPDLTGHHAPYLRHLLRGIADVKAEVIVLTAQGAASTQQFELHLKDIAATATWDESLAPTSNLPRNARGLSLRMLDALKRHHADHVWVPYADYVSLYLGARAFIGRKVRWPAGLEAEGLNFRSTFAYPAPKLRKHLSRTLSQLFTLRANWDILHLLDPIPYELIRKRMPGASQCVRLMPDPVERVRQIEPHVAREKMGIPTSGRYIGCMGVLYDPTTIERLLVAFRQAKLGAKDRLLLAGPMAARVRDCVARDFGDLTRSGRIITIDRHLSLDEVMLGVMAVDVVCVPMKFRMGSSSFIIRAVAAGKPVVADDFGWTGWVMNRFDLGWSVDLRNIGRFSNALRTAIENADSRTVTPAARRFASFHSAENFKAHWTWRLRERIGLPPDPNLISWQWVLDEPLAVQA